MEFLSTEGYLIRWHDMGGGDRCYRFFTRLFGLIQVIASRKKLSQFPSLAYPAPFDRADLRMVTRRQKAGTRLVDYLLVSRNTWLSEDLEKLSGSMRFLETLEKLSPEEEPQPGPYQLLEDYLDEVRVSPFTWYTVTYGMLKLFNLLGYEPALDFCRKCHKAPSRRNYFLVSKGGFVHEDCLFRAADGIFVSPGTLLFLKRLSNLTIQGTRRLKGDKLIQKESSEIIGSFINYLCQKKLNSQLFMEKICHEPEYGNKRVVNSRRKEPPVKR